MCDCEEKLKSLEKKMDRVIAICLEIQLTQSDRGAATERRKRQMKAYIGDIGKTLKSKGMDTTLFDNLQNLMDG